MNLESVPSVPALAAAQSTEQLLAALCAAHPRSADSLRVVHRVCVNQRNRGEKDFSLETIGRLSAQQKGPSGSYLRTRPAARYRAIIDSIKRTVVQPRAVRRPSDIDSVLEGVADPTVRARVGILLSELHSLRREKRGFGSFAAQDRRSAHTAALTNATTAMPEGWALTALERMAIQLSIEPSKLDDWGWKIDAKGRVVARATNAVVFPAAFVSAIGKILAAQSTTT